MTTQESPQVVGDQILAAGGEEQAAGWSHDHPRMIVRSAFQFLERDFPPIEPIAGGVFLAPQIVMVYARPGVGKTYFSLTFAMALALGQKVDVCGWQVGEEPLPVLYVDGEMDGEEMQERIENLLRGSGTWQTRTEPSLYILSRADMFDATGKGIPDLSDPLGREAIEDAIEQVGAKVVIIDNLSSLVIKGDENSSEDWAEINQWLLRLRAMGLHVMVVHHAGKSGSQRGSSKREDNVNMIVKLEHPEDYEASDLGRFVLSLDKVRRVTKGSEVAKREVRIVERFGGQWLEATFPEADNESRILAAYESGITSPTEIAKEIGLSKSTASRHLKRLREHRRIH